MTTAGADMSARNIAQNMLMKVDAVQKEIPSRWYKYASGLK